MNPTLSTRSQLATLVPNTGQSMMIELGVARADFAVELMRENPSARYIGIDRYSDHHGDDEYLFAWSRISASGGSLVRSTFSASLSLPLPLSDLIYVDGYAHTGQESGQTLRDWYPRVRPGGVFAGHDYDLKWKPTMEAVDEFVRSNGLKLSIIREKPYSSWWVRKPLDS